MCIRDSLYTIFVFLQLFNQINARRLSNELNIFKGFFSNWISVGVFAAEVVLQVIITEFTGYVFSVCLKGLTWQQWLISMAFCLGSWVVRALLTFVDFEKLPEIGNKEESIARHRLMRGSSRVAAEIGMRGSLVN
eukprot:TRINITY_DN3807_c0_g1_i4.p1 TRINITY_DN3807_c0_g1~~TRINITY_DN3807_c0_g1_i4.p1  ORF type:complete len:135 (-),score=40.12 TRINITY_DN3807_c0_g1_i4:66-470(-)